MGSFCSFLFVLDTDLRPDLCRSWPWNQEELIHTPTRAIYALGRFNAGPCHVTVTSCVFPQEAGPRMVC